MSKQHETGHAINVAAFGGMIEFAKALGQRYAPTVPAILVPALEAKLEQFLADLETIKVEENELNNAINDRAPIFNGLDTLSSRLVSALETVQSPKERIDDAKTLLRKIQGKRAKPMNTDEKDPEQPQPASHSASQQSFVNKVEHFSKLIKVMESEPKFSPGENDIKRTALNERLEQMILRNQRVAAAQSRIGDARRTRDDNFYTDTNGMKAISKAVKSYVKQAFGPSSPEFRAVSKFKITTI